MKVGVYNPSESSSGLFKLNYRMHDKYVIVDNEMYLLGGRNSNDIFLGDYTTDINVDRDILVWDTYEQARGNPCRSWRQYFHQVWNEDCVKIKGGRKQNISENRTQKEKNMENGITDGTQGYLSKYEKQYQSLEARYAALTEKSPDIETYNSWERDTIPANKITLLDNGTQAGPKTSAGTPGNPLSGPGMQSEVTIQTPYVICNGYMYDAF